MIVFDLKCGPAGHVFEAWFGSTEDYRDQRGRGLVCCPLCGSGDVDKAVMAPRLGASSSEEAPAGSPADSKRIKEMLAALATAQKEMLASSDNVGDRFADEARAIHLGEAAARSIHGRATRADAQSLIEEGIAVAPLPFPIADPNREN